MSEASTTTSPDAEPGAGTDNDTGTGAGTDTLAGLVARAADGDPRAVARLISMIENASPQLPRLLRLLAPATGRAHVVGITGPPGVGKSTTTAGLVAAYREAGLRVGVLAVDPSSPFTGGALLGDRVRMQAHALDRDVLIRSMATRGHLGGLAAAAAQALRVYDLAGCDVALVETVGVGQSEVEVASACDTTVVLLAPGMGDGIQAAKAGILEIGDVFVVNKADRDGAPALTRELRAMTALGDRAHRPPVLRLIATTGEGTTGLVAAVAEHRRAAEESGAWQERRLARARSEVTALVLGALRRRISAPPAGLASLARRVRDGELDPYAASREVLAALEGAERTGTEVPGERPS